LISAVLRETRPEYAEQPEEDEAAGRILEFPAPAEPRLREEELVHLWQGQRFPREALRTRQGDLLQVIHPGRRNPVAGPDFRHAVIADQHGRLLRGDVELHVRATDFAAHGHHRDRRYDNVILHVVFHDDGPGFTLLACGRRTPVVALAPWVARRAEELRLWLAQPSSFSEPCRSAVALGGWPEVARLLNRLGQMRFRQKQARFAAALRREGANQALYEGILRVLGYSRNQEPFARLARLVPYERLHAVLAGEGLPAAEALLLGSAGFLPVPSGRASPYLLDLERRWDRLAGPRLPPETWRLNGLRPENHPVRRLAGLARLVARRPSLVAGLNTLEESRSIPMLIAAWQVAADSARASNSSLPHPALIGRGRALELLINALLPFAAAFGQMRGLSALSQRALALYLRLPTTGSYGGTRFLESVLRPPFPDNAEGAYRQQGRLYLYNHYCSNGQCAVCPLSGGQLP
jgi:hypothetical protein